MIKTAFHGSKRLFEENYLFGKKYINLFSGLRANVEEKNFCSFVETAINLCREAFWGRFLVKLINLIFVFKQTNFFQSFSGMGVKSSFYVSVGKNCGRCFLLKKFLMLHFGSKFEQKKLGMFAKLRCMVPEDLMRKTICLKRRFRAVFGVLAKSLLTFDKRFRHCWQNCYKHVQMKLLTY